MLFACWLWCQTKKQTGCRQCCLVFNNPPFIFKHTSIHKRVFATADNDVAALCPQLTWGSSWWVDYKTNAAQHLLFFVIMVMTLQTDALLSLNVTGNQFDPLEALHLCYYMNTGVYEGSLSNTSCRHSDWLTSWLVNRENWKHLWVDARGLLCLVPREAADSSLSHTLTSWNQRLLIESRGCVETVKRLCIPKRTNSNNANKEYCKARWEISQGWILHYFWKAVWAEEKVRWACSGQAQPLC